MKPKTQKPINQLIWALGWKLIEPKEQSFNGFSLFVSSKKNSSLIFVFICLQDFDFEFI